MRRAIHRLLVWWLRETTAHVAPNCGRWSGYHDDGMPMICNRRAGHFGRSHYDSMNGLIWRSGEEPAGGLLIVDDPDPRTIDVSRWQGATADDLHPIGATFDHDEWLRARDAFGAVLALEDMVTDATNRSADAYIVPGVLAGCRLNDRPILDGTRPGIILYTTDPGAHHEQ